MQKSSFDVIVILTSPLLLFTILEVFKSLISNIFALHISMLWTFYWFSWNAAFGFLYNNCLLRTLCPLFLRSIYYLPLLLGVIIFMHVHAFIIAYVSHFQRRFCIIFCISVIVTTVILYFLVFQYSFGPCLCCC